MLWKVRIERVSVQWLATAWMVQGLESRQGREIYFLIKPFGIAVRHTQSPI